MSETLPEKRWAENEVIFRKINERVTDGLALTKTIAQEDGQQDLIKDIDNLPLLFHCECANEKCRQRISLTSKEYEQQHSNKSRFILVPGHNIPKIERIVFNSSKYIVVEKYMTPAYKAVKLNSTNLKKPLN